MDTGVEPCSLVLNLFEPEAFSKEAHIQERKHSNPLGANGAQPTRSQIVDLKSELQV